MNRRYELEDSVRIFSNGMDEIRFRKGVWNFEEAALDTNMLAGELKEAVIAILGDLAKGERVSVDEKIKKFKLTQDDENVVESIMNMLQEQSYITSDEKKETQKLLREIIGGTVVDRFTGDVGMLKPVLFFTDSEYIKKSALELSKEIKLPITVMTEKDAQDIAAADLTTKFDALSYKEQMEEFKNIVEPYCCVVVSMERPHVKFLRNLNRILIELSKPFVMSMMDGPFMSLITIKPPETGCFECFENRVLARIEEMSVYEKFVEQTGGPLKVREKTLVSPLIQTMTSAAIFEAVMIASIGRAKLSGRILNVYVPVLEIQIQDLLRVPFCPACGFVAKAQMEEMYSSSKKIVDSLLDTIVIDKRKAQ